MKLPSYKEFLAKKKTGPKLRALHKKLDTLNAGTGRRLTNKEQKLKTANWPKYKGSSVAWPTTAKHKKEHQETFKRAWNE